MKVAPRTGVKTPKCIDMVETMYIEGTYVVKNVIVRVQISPPRGGGCWLIKEAITGEHIFAHGYQKYQTPETTLAVARSVKMVIIMKCLHVCKCKADRSCREGLSYVKRCHVTYLGFVTMRYLYPKAWNSITTSQRKPCLFLTADSKNPCPGFFFFSQVFEDTLVQVRTC
jgi:hypothetical protein